MVRQVGQFPWCIIGLAVLGCSSGSSAGDTVPAPVAEAAGTAALAGRWDGTVTHDVTQKTGPISFTISGNDDSLTGTVSLAGMNLPVSLRQTGDEISGSIDGAYTDPGCNCSVVSEVQGTIQGATITGSVSARDARTGQWSFSNFTVTRRGR